MHSLVLSLLFVSIRLLHLAIPATLPLQPAISLPSSTLAHAGLTFPKLLKYYQPPRHFIVIVNFNVLFSASVTPTSTSTSRFPIPRTSLLLHIVSFLDTPIRRDGLGRAILHGQEKARLHMSIHEDSYLWPEDERKSLLPLLKQPIATALWICRTLRAC